MTSIDSRGNAGDTKLPLQQLPTGALQAIYHAVTGKTESMSKNLEGNVIVEKGDVENLYWMLREQIGHYALICEPTVTIVINYADEKSVTYSSWEKFQALQIHHLDIVSDIIIKIELVLRLPGTDIDQRLVISVLIDSSLPMIIDDDTDMLSDIPWFIYGQRKWNTVKTTIDFVDFLVARVFNGIVEEWFSKLQKTPSSKINDSLLDRYSTISTALAQMNRVGMAIFIASLVWMKGNDPIDIRYIAYGVSISLIIWAIFSIFGQSIMSYFYKKVIRNFIPTVIILNDGDRRAYEKVKLRATPPFRLVAVVVFTALFNIGTNLISSLIYSGSS